LSPYFTSILSHLFFSIGIFAYLNYLEPKTRREILELLIKGLQRLEYRGYDSAGKNGAVLIVKLIWHWE